MSRPIWTGFLADGMWSLVEQHYNFGRDLDSDYRDPDTPRSVTVSEAVSRVLGPHGVELPTDDGRLLARLRQRGAEGERPGWWLLAALQDDRLGLVTPKGVIETCGPALALVESPEDGRYTGYYCVPGLWYMGVRSNAQRRDLIMNGGADRA